MLDQARKQPRSAKRIVTALRSLLRFLHVDGILAVPLAGAVPSPAGHALAGLPRALEPGQVEAMLSSCDPATATGRRDRAVLLLLSRMGLRAGEVAGLGLDDIDWRRGEITVRGKGNRRDRLPLPADVGAAVVAYLRDGRPAGALDRTVFIAAQAPRKALSYAGITTIVAEAAARAGVPGPVHAHRLRHSAATAMLRGGGSLTEIGQALRHARPATTAIYAKVDTGALRPLGRPWPGAGEARMTADGRPLRDSLEDYLALRRALGFRLKHRRAAARPVRRLPRSTAVPARSPPKTPWHGRRFRPGHRRPGRRSGSPRSAGSPPTCTAPTRRSRFPRPG